MSETPKIIGNNMGAFWNNKTSRRKAIQAAFGAGTLAAAGSLPLGSALTPKLARGLGDVQRNATTDGQNWQTVAGTDFRPLNSATTYNSSIPGVISAISNVSNFYCRLTLPDGARITTVRGYLYNSVNGGSSLALVGWKPYAQAFQYYGGKSLTVPGDAYQSVLITGTYDAPLTVVDNYNYSYMVSWTPGGVGTNFELAGVEIGWLGPVGSLNPLAVPSRFIDTRPTGQIGTLSTLAPNSTNNYTLAGASGVTQPGVAGSPTLTIPPGASAVVGNVTIVAPQASGRLKINPGSTDRNSGTGVITWVGSSGNTLSYSNSFNVALKNGQISLALFCPAAVDIAIDIVGYYF